jgi:hypothetical protein
MTVLKVRNASSTIVSDYRYQSGAGVPSVCGLQIYRIPWGPRLVIANAHSLNDGVSITTWACELATLVCHEHKIPPKQMVWVEHYPGCCGLRGGWDLVNFRLQEFRQWYAVPGPGCACAVCRGSFLPETWRFVQPEWRPMTRDDFWELGAVPPDEVTE